MSEYFIPPHGGYRDLLSFRKARIIYDGTVLFCQRFLGAPQNGREKCVEFLATLAL